MGCSMSRKELVYVTTRLPWPADDGRKVTLYNYCKGLHELCDYDITLFSFLGPSQSPNTEFPDFIKQVVLADDINAPEKAINIAKNYMDKSKTLQSALFWSVTNAKRFKDLLNDVNPDVVIIDMIRLLPYGEISKSLGYKTVIDVDDLLSKRYERQLGQDADILGAHKQKSSKSVNHLASIQGIKNHILRQESCRMRRVELRCSEEYDSFFFVSPIEASEYKKNTGSQNVFAAGMGADIGYFSEEVQYECRPNTLSFVGNLSAAANIASIKYILKDVLPKTSGNYKLVVIGNCPIEVEDEITNNLNVELLGRVEDLRISVKSTSIFLAPIAFGSGIKTKIVEAMAMGMCVVTNSLGAEGLTAKNDVELVIRDDPFELAACIDKLMEDECLRSKIGEAAQRYAKCNHDWNDLLKAFPENGF